MKKSISRSLIPVLAVVFTVAGTFTAAHAQDFSAPTVPQGISATPTQTPNQIYVSWGSSDDDTGVVGYYLYRNGALIANTPGYTYYTDTVTGGSYSYTVAAYDAAGNVSGQSNPTPYLTVIPDTTAPSKPTGISFLIASTSITISWNASTDDTAVAGYYVYRNGLKVGTSDPITGTTYTDTGLSQGVTYTYAVAAYDASGNISQSSNAQSIALISDGTPPSTPYILTAKVISPTEVFVSWPASTDNIQVAGYNVYRNGYLITTVTTNSYDDTQLVPATTYGYYVTAYDEAGNTSGQSPTVNATTLPPDLTAPSIPTNLSAVAASSMQVNLSWTPSTDNTAVTGYYVYRDGNEIGSTDSNTYIDTGLSTSTTYTYAVMAHDAAGNISPQTSAAVTTLATADLNLAGLTQPPLSGPVPPPDTTVSPPGGTPMTTNFGAFVTALFFGLRTGDVLNLQNLLIAQGYLSSSFATGYYGSLTQQAVQKFQCAQSIVCAGSPGTTGWGSVGPKTRNALNILASGGAGASASGSNSASAQTQTSVNAAATLQQLLAEVQALQAQLAAQQQQQ